jgi:hypothetical protein
VTDEDKARAAQRLLEEPMLAEALALVESDAIKALLAASDDTSLRACRDYVLAVQAIPVKLHAAMLKVQEAKRPRPRVV